jgi:hypothetical protein
LFLFSALFHAITIPPVAYGEDVTSITSSEVI